MSDSVDVLNRSCHADVRIMYRQRFFSENSAKLVDGFNTAPQGSQVWEDWFCSETALWHFHSSDLISHFISVNEPQALVFLCFLTEKKPNYLKALSNIVNKLPKQVQVTELPAVSPQQTLHDHLHGQKHPGTSQLC